MINSYIQNYTLNKNGSRRQLSHHRHPFYDRTYHSCIGLLLEQHQIVLPQSNRWCLSPRRWTPLTLINQKITQWHNLLNMSHITQIVRGFLDMWSLFLWQMPIRHSWSQPGLKDQVPVMQKWNEYRIQVLPWGTSIWIGKRNSIKDKNLQLDVWW